MPFAIVLLVAGGVAVVLLTFAVVSRFWFRNTGAHNRVRKRGQVPYAILRPMSAWLAHARHRNRFSAAPENRIEADRVVGAHAVRSDRLMDSPTSRLHPSTRHRVPPWVPTPGAKRGC